MINVSLQSKQYYKPLDIFTRTGPNHHHIATSSPALTAQNLLHSRALTPSHVSSHNTRARESEEVETPRVRTKFVKVFSTELQSRAMVGTTLAAQR